MTSLPIQEITPELLANIVTKDCILSAPPGAGKSTYLPLQLLSLPCFANTQILLLQPRQVAVRSIANFLADQLNEKVGKTVGYQMRGESSVSSQTRLLVITEGLLIAKLQSDPELSKVGLVIFDEFHERSVQSDIALGLSLEVQSGLREDLRLLVMSATLNVNEVKKLMPLAKVMSSQGRSFPIDYLYRPVPTTKQNKTWALEDTVLNTVLEAHGKHVGNILVFLPGAAPIKRISAKLNASLENDTIIAPLYGALTAQQQKQAIAIPAKGMRKIVLATNIAETSLTIDGVNIVVDSGREKVQRFHIARKLNQLSEQMISKASSIQRAGRAGRQQAGFCYRLWSQEQQQFLLENTPAQITEVDISQTLLTLLEWGSDFAQLPLINKPSQAQIDYAFSLLTQLGLVNAEQQITQMGKQASRFNTHPRLASLLVHAHEELTNIQKTKLLTAVLVAVIEGKPLDRLVGSIDIVMQCKFILKYLHAAKKPIGTYEVYKDIKRITAQLGININDPQTKFAVSEEISESIAAILLHAFPDKIGYKRLNATYTLADGTGAEFISEDANFTAQWIICTNTQLTTKTNGAIRQYCELPTSLRDNYLIANSQIRYTQSWDEQLSKVVGKKVTSLYAIEILSQASQLKADETTKAILIQQIRRKGLSSLLGKANKLLERMYLAKIIDARFAEDFPDVSSESLMQTMEEWLAPYLANISSWQQLSQLNWVDIVSAMLSYQQKQYVNEYFPTHFLAPSGNNHRLDYSEQGKVTLAIRVQELYGLTSNPSVGKANFPITLSLLSPGHKEIQKTSDLAGFWTGSYSAVQKEMKGRYPKHFWPDDPANSIPTTKTKKKMGSK